MLFYVSNLWQSKIVLSTFYDVLSKWILNANFVSRPFRLQKMYNQSSYYICNACKAQAQMTVTRKKLMPMMPIIFGYEFVGSGSVISEIPGSLVSEPKHRDSRSKTRLGLGTGLEFSRTVEPESDSESNFLSFWNRNRYRNRILRSEVPESEPELYFR